MLPQHLKNDLAIRCGVLIDLVEHQQNGLVDLAQGLQGFIFAAGNVPRYHK